MVKKLYQRDSTTKLFPYYVECNSKRWAGVVQAVCRRVSGAFKPDISGQVGLVSHGRQFI